MVAVIVQKLRKSCAMIESENLDADAGLLLDRRGFSLKTN